MLFTVTGFLDRLILTALLIRVWGTHTFETWVTLLAIAGLVSLFEFGFNLYFNNAITFKMERGDTEGAARALAIANTIFFISALIGILIFSVALFAVHPISIINNSESLWALIFLCSGCFARVSVCGVLSLYRANQQYGRLITIMILGEVSRITIISVSLFLGSNILGVAILTAFCQIIFFVLIPIYDTRKLFNQRSRAFGWPSATEFRESITLSTAYFAQIIPANLLLALPVIILDASSGAVGALAAFVLLRTLANTARTPIITSSIVVGMEIGRLVAVSEQKSASENLLSAARAMALASGLLVGGLTAGGQDIIRLWTNDISLYSDPLMLAAMLPMVLAPLIPLSHNVLVSSNAPYLAAIGRWVQMGLTAIGYYMIPIDDPGLRMMVALSLGEVLAFGPITSFAASRLVSASGWLFHIQSVLWAIIGCSFAYCITASLNWLMASNTALSTVIYLALASALSGIFLIAVGFSNATRSRIMHEMFGRKVTLRD